MSDIRKMAEMALKAHDAECMRLRETHKEQDHEDLCRAAMVQQIERVARSAVDTNQEACANQCDEYAAYLDSQGDHRESDMIKGIAEIIRNTKVN
jgi:hypothetical protein